MIDKEIEKELPFCTCDCGKRVTKSGNRYIHGHNRRNKYNTKEHNKKISKALEGHEVLEETRKKIGETVMGFKHTEEAKKKIGVASKGRPSPKKNKTYEEIYGDQAKNEREKRGRSQLLSYEQDRIPGMLNKHHTKETRQKLHEFFGGDRYLGENNPNWQGGISNLPYPFEFNDEFKELIRERDNYTCMLCKLTQEQVGHTLCVHHIDYDKDNLDPDNFVSLCRSCHGVTSGKNNREYWTNTFQQKMKLRFCMIS